MHKHDSSKDHKTLIRKNFIIILAQPNISEYVTLEAAATRAPLWASEDGTALALLGQRDPYNY